jgi:hypothetical protein
MHTRHRHTHRMRGRERSNSSIWLPQIFFHNIACLGVGKWAEVVLEIILWSTSSGPGAAMVEVCVTAERTREESKRRVIRKEDWWRNALDQERGAGAGVRTQLNWPIHEGQTGMWEVEEPLSRMTCPNKSKAASTAVESLVTVTLGIQQSNILCPGFLLVPCCPQDPCSSHGGGNSAT